HKRHKRSLVAVGLVPSGGLARPPTKSRHPKANHVRRKCARALTQVPQRAGSPPRMCSAQVSMGTGTCNTRLQAMGSPKSAITLETPARDKKTDVFVLLGLTGASTGGYPHPFL